MAIASRLARLMGGAIAVTSAPGHGSTFAFSIPLTWVPIGSTTSNEPEAECSEDAAACDSATPSDNDDPGTPSVASRAEGGVRQMSVASFGSSVTSASSREISAAPSTIDLSTSADSRRSSGESPDHPNANRKRTSWESLGGGPRGNLNINGCVASASLPPLPPRPAPPAFRMSSFFASSAASSSQPSSPSRNGSKISRGPLQDADNNAPNAPQAPSVDILAGRSAMIDVPHYPTAAQLTDSCLLAGMAVATGSDDESKADVCITTPARALSVLRNGWKGRPVVVVGSRDEIPLGILPAIVLVSTPVQHERFLDGMRKALAPCIAILEAPLHPDPALLTAIAQSNRAAAAAVVFAGGLCRHSLDNSALDRRHIYSLTSAALRQRDGGERQGWVPHLDCVRSESPISARRSNSLERSELPEIDPAMNTNNPSSTSNSVAAVVASNEVVTDANAAKENFRILVAEDNPINVRVVLRVLSHVLPNTKVDVVGNGLEVLAATAKKRYDLLLLDIHMPEMDGLEAARLLRERDPEEIRPTIVALSADTLLALQGRCAAVGITDFVSKPFRVEDVERVIALAMEKKVEAGKKSSASMTNL